MQLLPKLLPNWKQIIRGAWSSRLAILSVMLGIAEVSLPYFTGFVPPRTMAVLSMLTAALGVVARAVAQPSLHTNDAKQ